MVIPSHTNMVKNNVNIKSSYKKESINLGYVADLDSVGPTTHGSAVFDCEGWFSGFQPVTWDSDKSKLTRNNFAVHYRTGDFQLNSMSVILGTEFGGSVYQKEIHLDIWVSVAWLLGTSCTHLVITAKYHLSFTASVSAKTNSSSLVDVGYVQPLSLV